MATHESLVGQAQKPFLFSAAISLVIGLMANSAIAIPANPHGFTEVQPDGTVVRMRVRGDEHFNWAEDGNGFTVVRNRNWFEYARLNPQGKLVPSGYKVGIHDPVSKGLSPGVLPAPAQRAPGINASSKTSQASTAQSSPPSGLINNLVVLVQFSNHVGRVLPSTSEIHTLLNAPGGDPVLAPTGSVRDVYLENSYGQMDLRSDIAPWITVSGTEDYYANGVSGDSTLWEALREALNQLDQSIDFSQYDINGDGRIDSITFLHSGYGAEFGGTDSDGSYYSDRIWSHRWVMQSGWTSEEGVLVDNYHISPSLWGTYGSEIGHIGVIAHETGHFFGLPDLYDTDGGGSGIGYYGLMANSWGFDGTQLCPSSLSAWSKMQLGWISPTRITGSGEYSIGQSESYDEYFMIADGYNSGEYLLIENRQRAGFDCALRQGGLAIWHIDELAEFDEEGYPGGRWPKDGKHYRVALAQADGRFQLEKGHNNGDDGDLHHAGGVEAMAPGPDLHPNTDGYQKGRIVNTGHVISNISASGSVMTFCLNGCDGPLNPDPVGGYNAPTDLHASVETLGKGKSVTRNVTLSWVDNSNEVDNEVAFLIERCKETGKGKSKVCVFSEHAVLGQDVILFSESLDAGTYMYRVKARRGENDDTAYSNEVKI